MEHPNQNNSSKIPEYYNIDNCFRQLVQQHQDNLANNEIKRIAKEERKSAPEAKKEKEAKKKVRTTRVIAVRALLVRGVRTRRTKPSSLIYNVQYNQNFIS